MMPTAVLIGIMLLAAALNFINIEAIGDGNTYYTAAVEAMLQSPSNFFFAAAEPGGSVSVDKPPLGLWLQAISAMFLGVNGFAVALPQILAGIFSVPLVYWLVKRYFGTGAGLISALVMAIMPVSVAVQRNNTMDATLIFTLLLAAWAFVKATDTGKLKWLILGGVFVGLGFNIKMLQAFLPVPAFYALYFLGAKIGWRRKIIHLTAATAVLMSVSFAWIIAVDLTPADQRPYVGSSDSNSALELAIGYNGLQRLLGRMGGGSAAAADDGARDGAMTPPAGRTPPNGAIPPSDGGVRPDDGAQGVPGGTQPGSEIGSAGVFRLFSQPLDNEIGCVLPFGLFSAGLLVIASRPRLPLSTAHMGAVLFGGWLVTEIVFFSAAGFFHAYYLAMITPPLAALVGIGVMRLWKLRESHHLLAIALLIAAAGATLAYQISIAAGYTPNLTWGIIPAAALVIGAAILLAARFIPRVSRFAVAGLVLVVIAMTAVPTVWAGLTTLNSGSNIALPAAYAGNSGANSQRAALAASNGGLGRETVSQTLIDYLQANTEGMRYMMAVGSSMQGAQVVLETGRGVLYMGGFNGSDSVVDAESLQALVDAGELRYVLSSGGGNMPRGMNGGAVDTNISAWLTESCTVVTDVTTTGTLYDCAG